MKKPTKHELAKRQLTRALDHLERVANSLEKAGFQDLGIRLDGAADIVDGVCDSLDGMAAMCA